MYCSKCGTKQNEGEKFCPNCGTKFEVATSTPIEPVSNNEAAQSSQLKPELQDSSEIKLEEETYVSKYITDTDSLIKEAKEGNIAAMLRLAFRYECGLGVKQNEAKAEELYKKVESRGFSKGYLDSCSLIRMEQIIVRFRNNKGNLFNAKKKKIIDAEKAEPLKVYGYKQNEKTGEIIAMFLLPLKHPSIQSINSKVIQYNTYAEVNGYNKITFDLISGLIEGTFERKNRKVGFFQRLFGVVDDYFMETHFLEIFKLCEITKM